MQNRPIRFVHRGRVVEIDAAMPTRTVLEWLREDARCCGTKEGCNEGDCGACTVVIGELAGADDTNAVRGLVLHSVNACIRLLPTLDGKALFTVEDLQSIQAQRAATDGALAASRVAAPNDTVATSGATAAHAGTAAHGLAADHAAVADPLHPVQRAMVECHGSQCGFCTPGFVMSMWSRYERDRAAGSRATRQQLADELSGNLCRCTGYRPILDAGERMYELPPAVLDTAPVVAALAALRDAAPLQSDAEGARYAAPRSLDELARLRAEHPQAVLLSGATDIGLWITKQLRALPELIYLGDVAELKRIESDGHSLRIGAGASLENAWAALALQWPALREVWLRFASVPVRNAGTLGGNIANGSPIGDGAPVLMALAAQIELRRGERLRSMPLADFYVDYMKNRLEPGEFVEALVVPLDAGLQVRAYKISKRYDCDISAVCAGLAIELDGDIVRRAHFAFGGMAATVRHATRAEAAVIGQAWSGATLAAAQHALADDYTPLTDMRASAAYRLQVAQNLLHRFWLETRRTDALTLGELSVWSGMAEETIR